MNEFILPIISQFEHDNNILKLSTHGDDLVIDFLNKTYNEIRISLPFSAYYFLVVVMFFDTKLKKILLLVHMYNISLFIISPFLILILFSGVFWIGPLINSHEIAYKGMFLCIGMLFFSSDLKLIQKNK